MSVTSAHTRTTHLCPQCPLSTGFEIYYSFHLKHKMHFIVNIDAERTKIYKGLETCEQDPWMTHSY